MHTRSSSLAIAAIAIAAVLAFPFVAPGPAAGQGRRGPAVKGQPLAQTPDGQPDVQGTWGSDAYTQDLETGLPDEETNAIQGRPAPDPSKATSVITDPPGGKIPYQPWATDKRLHIPTFRRGETSKGETTSLRDVRPQSFCLVGLPRLNWYGDFQITQIPGFVIMEWEWSHAFRVIPLDATRPHPPAIVKLSMGDARGHWEGHTLVVETANMNDWDWLDATGTFHSSDMTMVERFNFADTQTMKYDVTLTDPKIFTRPFTITLPFVKRALAPDYQILEAACVEGNRGLGALINTRTP